MSKKNRTFAGGNKITTSMKKFFYYSCGISAIIVAICAIAVTVYVMLPKKNTFNVNIEGKRNYVTYKITGSLPPNEVASFVKKKTDELNPRKENQYNR